MASRQEKKSELKRRAEEGETLVYGGTGGKSLEDQEHLAEERNRGGQVRKDQLGTEGYQEIGRKRGLSMGDEFGGDRVKREGVEIDLSKYKTKG
ncbi:hypothetical protein CQW23_07015 [Capsicum baccatum]|uniref:Uncharacterized protein n=1 Tax=Capsicum baccatum TaxID=33114 RepID=A0A2G2X518_CAPBA|nr:hypothetical protein CQW23_07015 [Capsicum baccatum]